MACHHGGNRLPASLAPLHARPRTPTEIRNAAPARLDPVELTRALIRCPSVTPREAGTLDLLEDVLSDLGFQCHRAPVLPFAIGHSGITFPPIVEFILIQ